MKSDLHYAILARFREAGIEIPYPQRELRWREHGATDGNGLGSRPLGRTSNAHLNAPS